MKKIFKYFVICLLAFTSCTSENDKRYRFLKGEWQVTKFYHKDDDLGAKGKYLIGFENAHNLWLTRLDDEKEQFLSASYTFFKQQDTLKMELKKSQVPWLNRDYNVYIDTLDNLERNPGDKQHVVQITFDNEDVYIEAIRLKNND